MRDKVLAFIKSHDLLNDKEPVLVGFSGGGDSIALLTILVKLGFSCVAAHCNFHLRGNESLRDEMFSRQYADSLHVPFYKTDFDTLHYAEEKGISVEMAARELRYDWFEKLRVQIGAQAIAIAHHRDDSIETLLINLIRGTGIHGLTGIRPRNGFVVRPLLCVGKEEILAWLKENKIDFVTDSTNLSDAYVRNYIRIDLLPMLENVNPSVREALERTAEHLSDAAIIYDAAIEEAKRNIFIAKDKISIEKLHHYPAPETLLYESLHSFGFTASVVLDIFRSLNGESGKQFYSPTHYVLKDRDCLLISSVEKPDEVCCYVGSEDGSMDVPISLAWETKEINGAFRITKDKAVATFDLGKLEFPLELRHWKEGDSFVPFGMKGRKKVSDYFSDHKFSRIEKECTWLLCCKETIIWIVGERTDDNHRIDEGTKKAFVIKYLPKEDDKRNK